MFWCYLLLIDCWYFHVFDFDFVVNSVVCCFVVLWLAYCGG